MSIMFGREFQFVFCFSISSTRFKTYIYILDVSPMSFKSSIHSRSIGTFDTRMKAQFNNKTQITPINHSTVQQIGKKATTSRKEEHKNETKNL